METRDLVKILVVLYFGLVICLFGSFQTMKITENLLLSQTKEDKDKTKEDKDKKEKEDDSILVTITDSLFFKIANEVVSFINKILNMIKLFIEVFF